MAQETWNSFWGPLLLRRFHLDNPERWSARERKADWLLVHLAPPPGGHLVDLGCGDGVLSICLARRGYPVTAVDRIASILEAAQAEAGDAPVAFVTADLREYDLGEACLDGAVFLGTFGLLDHDAQLDLFRRVARALRPGAALIVDWPPPSTEAGAGTWERPFDDGLLRVSHAFDPTSRVQTIRMEFHRPDGTTIELYDPLLGGCYTGLRRHLYDREEAQELLRQADLNGRPIPHYKPESGYHSLLGTAH